VPGDYEVTVLRGWTKEALARRLERALKTVPPEDIVSINYHADAIIWPFWRRNSALLTLRPPSD